MLRRVGSLQHGLVGVAAVGMAVLAGVGIIGAGDDGLFRPEHFDAKQVTVRPAGAEYPDGVRVREVVDIDFGRAERRGYQRIIPNDFGEPTDVTASSPDANDQVNASDFGSTTRIRVGNPSVTFTGQHRYVLEYTLPEARVTTGELALDVIGIDETLRTDRFDVIVVGFDLAEPTCNVGASGSVGGCEFSPRTSGGWMTTIEPLDPGDGITIGGTITDIDRAAPAPDVPGLPDRVPTGLRPLGILVLAVGAVVAFGTFRWIRNRGSNTVFGDGSAVDAALGAIPAPLPVPGPEQPVHDVVTHRVPDDRLAEMATVEFVPPRGLDPWHGNVLLRERVDDDTVRSWFSEMIARGAITVEGDDDDMSLNVGATDATLSQRDRTLLAELFADGSRVDLGTYDKDFATVWKSVRSTQESVVAESGWWERSIKGGTSFRFAKWWPVVVWAGIIAISAGGEIVSGIGAGLSEIGQSPVSAIGLTVFVVGIVALLAYRPMLASRTATGSALTLRTESFRRFLEASEGRHVEWAWERGVLREYSAWAVALGAASAWSDALKSSGLPDDERLRTTGPLFMTTNRSAFSSTMTAPSSSGSGGSSGGFSGGSVGGGGGGGSSGSW